MQSRFTRAGMRPLRALLLAASIITVLTSTPINATLLSSCPLLPGSSCLPPDDAGDSPGALVASRIDPFSFTTSVGVISGAIKAEVFRESSGTLDFYYIIFNGPGSTTPITGEFDSNFAGWSTSVAFRSDGSQVPGFVDGNDAPTSANRDTTASVIGFDFGPIVPNERSRVVVISTNAVYFTTGQMAIDGQGPLSTFQPSVPEPALLLPTGSALLLLIAWKTRRAHMLVDRPNDSFSSDSSFGISVGPPDGASALGIGANVPH